MTAFSPPFGSQVPSTYSSSSVMKRYAIWVEVEPNNSGSTATWPINRIGLPLVRLSGHCGAATHVGCPPNLVICPEIGLSDSVNPIVLRFAMKGKCCACPTTKVRRSGHLAQETHNDE